MLTDYQYEKLVKPILNNYADMENEIIKNIADKFKVTDKFDNATKMQAEKLTKLHGLDRENIRAIAKYSGKTQKATRTALKEAGFQAIDRPLYRKAFDKKLIKVNPEQVYENDKIQSVIRKAVKDGRNYNNMIQTKMTKQSKQEYVKIVNQAFLETSSGVYTYEESIKRALDKLADKGISVVQYKRKEGKGKTKIINYGVEGVVRRDILTAVRQTALATSMETIKALGINYVKVSAHLGARVDNKNPINNHAGWQGKIYMLEGENKKYKNFYKTTGYGELLGLGGVNCRHYFEPYIFGVSELPKKLPEKKVEKVYFLEQKQRELERELRKWKRRKLVNEQRLVEGVNNDVTKQIKEDIKFCNLKIKEKKKNLNNFINNHVELKRENVREYVPNTK